MPNWSGSSNHLTIIAQTKIVCLLPQSERVGPIWNKNLFISLNWRWRHENWHSGELRTYFRFVFPFVPRTHNLSTETGTAGENRPSSGPVQWPKSNREGFGLANSPSNTFQVATEAQLRMAMCNQLDGTQMGMNKLDEANVEIQETKKRSDAFFVNFFPPGLIPSIWTVKRYSYTFPVPTNTDYMKFQQFWTVCVVCQRSWVRRKIWQRNMHRYDRMQWMWESQILINSFRIKAWSRDGKHVLSGESTGIVQQCIPTNRKGQFPGRT